MFKSYNLNLKGYLRVKLFNLRIAYFYIFLYNKSYIIAINSVIIDSCTVLVTLYCLIINQYITNTNIIDFIC